MSAEFGFVSQNKRRSLPALREWEFLYRFWRTPVPPPFSSKKMDVSPDNQIQHSLPNSIASFGHLRFVRVLPSLQA